MTDTLTTHYSWTMPGDHVNTNTWGAEWNANLQAIDSQVFNNNANITNILSGTTLSLSRGADFGAFATVSFLNHGSTQDRWVLFETSDPESGGNAGSNFGLAAYDDSGASLGNVFTVARSTLLPTFNSLNVSGTLTVGTGLTSLYGALNVAGATSLGGSLAVTGAASVTGNFGVHGTFAVDGAATLGSTLGVGGAGFFGSTLQVAGVLQIRPGDNGITASSGGQYVSINGSTAVGTTSTFVVNGGGRGGFAFEFYNGATRISTIDGSGNYAVASDYRLKTVHGPAEDVGAMIDAVPVYDAEFKASGERYPMFLAHELQAACPFAVQGEKDATENGEIAPQMVSNSQLVTVLWAEIQSLRKRVAALEG